MTQPVMDVVVPTIPHRWLGWSVGEQWFQMTGGYLGLINILRYFGNLSSNGGLNIK